MTPSESASALFHDGLAGDPSAFDDACRAIIDGQRESGMHYEGRLVCNALRPLLVDAREKGRRDRATSLVARGVRIAAARAAGDVEFRRNLRLSEVQEDWVRFEGGSTTELFARLDALVEGDRLRFLEYNPFPSLLAYADHVADRFESTAIFRACAERHPLRCQRLVPKLVAALRESLSSIAPSGRPSVGLLMPSAGAQQVDEYPEVDFILDAIRAAGVDVRSAPFDELELRGGRLAMGGERVDGVILMSWDEIYAPSGRASPLWAATKAGTVTLLNSMCSGLLHGTKALFEVLSDAAFESMFPREVRDALRDHVPWTRYVAEGKTTYRGGQVETMLHLRERRRDLVLKPANEYGGHGVVLGWESSESEWETALEAALAGQYVAQERVLCAREVFPVAGVDGVELRSLFYDWNPFVWPAGETHGVLARLSDGAIMNVRAGASLVPVYAVGDRRADSVERVSPVAAGGK